MLHCNATQQSEHVGHFIRETNAGGFIVSSHPHHPSSSGLGSASVIWGLQQHQETTRDVFIKGVSWKGRDTLGLGWVSKPRLIGSR